MVLSKAQVEALLNLYLMPQRAVMGIATERVLVRHSMIKSTPKSLYQILAGNTQRYELTKKGFNQVDLMIGSLVKASYSNAP